MLQDWNVYSRRCQTPRALKSFVKRVPVHSHQYLAITEGLIVQAAIEGLSLMLQNSTAPPPMGMPPVDMPPAESPKPPSEVLLGGAGPAAGSGDLEMPAQMADSGAGNEGSSKGGWLGGGLFGSGAANV